MNARLIALLFGLLASHASAAGWDIAELMKALAANGGGRVPFVETRHLAMLDQPLSVTGELVYRAPSRLERHTRTPLTESMVLDGDTLSLRREGKTHTLRLHDYPEVAALIGSIRATLAGDRKTLERSYALSLSGSATQWTLTLLPSDPAVTKVVLRIGISGNGGEVRRVDILQADGDRTEMRIGPAVR